MEISGLKSLNVVVHDPLEIGDFSSAQVPLTSMDSVNCSFSKLFASIWPEHRAKRPNFVGMLPILIDKS